MADDREPQYRVVRKEKYDPNFERYWKEEFPTNTIKHAGRITAVDAGTLVTSYNTGPGSYLLVNRLDICADRETEFCIRDRSGTVDYIYLEAAGMHTVIGEKEAPVMVLKGSVRFQNLAGTSAGTYSVSFEGIAPQFGSETVA